MGKITDTLKYAVKGGAAQPGNYRKHGSRGLLGYLALAISFGFRVPLVVAQFILGVFAPAFNWFRNS